MSHARKQVRDAVVSTLGAVTGLTGKVLTYQNGPVSASSLPLVVVQTPSESVVETSMSRRHRELQVVVDCLDSGSDAVDAVDALAVLVENALDSATLGGLVANFRLASTEITFQTGQVALTGQARLTFTCTYHTPLLNSESIV